MKMIGGLLTQDCHKIQIPCMYLINDNSKILHPYQYQNCKLATKQGCVIGASALTPINADA